jgi:hypothetical protein
LAIHKANRLHTKRSATFAPARSLDPMVEDYTISSPPTMLTILLLAGQSLEARYGGFGGSLDGVI